jgi:hypothetical protein
MWNTHWNEATPAPTLACGAQPQLLWVGNQRGFSMTGFSRRQARLVRPKIKIAVVPVTRPTLRFAPKKTDSNYFIGNILIFFVKVVFMLPTSFLTLDISQYYLSVPLVCVKKLVFSNISKRITIADAPLKS